MSFKPHSKSPLLDEVDNAARSLQYSRTPVVATAGLSRRRSVETGGAPATTISVEDETWVGGRRPEKRRHDTIAGYCLLIVALAMFTVQTVSEHDQLRDIFAY